MGQNIYKSIKKNIEKNPNLKLAIADTLKLLQKDPFASKLETHKLKGKLSGSWACTVDYDLRIVFDFVKSSVGKEDDILLSDIGTHDEVY